VANRPYSTDPVTALAERTTRVDATVAEAASTNLFPVSGMALLAVGGFGRRELFPYSDVDLLLLSESERLAHENKERIAAFLQRLWDCGLRVSHSVRTPAECAEVHDGNSELNISLLDRRYLAGDGGLCERLEDKLPRFLHANRDALVRNLARLTRERHSKYAHTFYHLEPNVKETPGGLRDYQLLRWLEQLRGAGSGAVSLELRGAFLRLARIRLWLHTREHRDWNVLSFEAQDEIAADWEGDAGLAPPGSSPDAARWMREYYRQARAVYRAAARALETLEGQSSNLFAEFRDWRSRLGNSDVSVRRERAHLREPQRLDTDPELALRLFEFTARHGIPPSPEAAARIEARRGALRARFAAPCGLWPALNRIFVLPHAPLALRWMHETGALCAIFPELQDIECLVVRDFHHRYTVDEHTLVAIENLWAAPGPFTELLAEVERKGPLVMAALFHDAGKGAPRRGHVDGSLALVETAMARTGMPEGERESVRVLIRQHLELSRLMQSRDIFDPATAREAARLVETVELLKQLTLLTYADISAVNPDVMTPWRAGQLWQLYMQIYNELTRELETDRIQDASPERAAFLEGFPKRYLRTHTDAEIAAHMALEERGRKRGVAVEIRRTDAAWQMTLVAGDRPGLFAAAAGTLSGFGMNILRAEAFANRRGLVLDTFTFADPLRNLELNPTEVDRLRAVAERVLTGRMEVKELLRNRPKPAPPSRRARIDASVTFDSEASPTATLIGIVAEDRPGLLYAVASAISANGGNIEVVLVDTEAHKAIDVFYVTAGGKKLTEETQTAMGEAIRRACQSAGQ
jgi:[protein-PII] uridylyltransferase